tara:strand:+ start:1558 stop:1998 length:441 start_codon:yes stop_codon:yes gene_type:complete
MNCFLYNWNLFVSKIFAFYYNLYVSNKNEIYKIDEKTSITIKMNSDFKNNHFTNLYFNRYFDSRDIKKYSFEKIFNYKNSFISIDDIVEKKGYCYYITFNSNVHKRTKSFIDNIKANNIIKHSDIFSNEITIKNLNYSNNRINNIL